MLGGQRGRPGKSFSENRWAFCLPIVQIKFFWPVFYKELARHMIWCPNDHAASFSRLYLVEVVRPLMNYYWQQFPPLRSQRSFFSERFSPKGCGAPGKNGQLVQPPSYKQPFHILQKILQGLLINISKAGFWINSTKKCTIHMQHQARVKIILDQSFGIWIWRWFFWTIEEKTVFIFWLNISSLLFLHPRCDIRK